MTDINDNVIPEVLQDAVRGGIGRMAVLGSTGALIVNTTLANGQGRWGDKVKVPYFGSLGAMRKLSKANDGTQGAITQDDMVDTSLEAEVQHFYKVTTLTDWAANGSPGDKTAELTKQIIESAGVAIDDEAVDTAVSDTGWGSYIVDDSAKVMGWDTLVDAQTKLSREAKDFACIVMHPAVQGGLRKLKDSSGRPLFAETPAAGTAGTFGGIPIVLSAATSLVVGGGVYRSALMKRGSMVAWIDGRGMTVESQRMVDVGATIWGCHLYGAVHRYGRMGGLTLPGVVIMKTKV
jgi:HK97 family phage major capsid protein